MQSIRIFLKQQNTEINFVYRFLYIQYMESGISNQLLMLSSLISDVQITGERKRRNQNPTSLHSKK